ncbi:DUF192 domain-containing protein [Methylibium sp.]|uniref:DUF192 domain-containing protein n=1 Tax=Methylibium sp. TaxID=2067992 RepID=UPI003D0A8E32
MLTKIKFMRLRLPHTAGLVLALAALLSGPATLAQTGPQKLPAVRLNAGIHNIQAEVARTPEQRAIGLMNRPTMGSNDGMLFVFEEAATQCFWMKNTLLPLSIAYLADDGTVLQIVDMPPQTLESKCSTKPVRLVLEMNQGWFAKRGFKAGSRLSGPAFKP